MSKLGVPLVPRRFAGAALLIAALAVAATPPPHAASVSSAGASSAGASSAGANESDPPAPRPPTASPVVTLSFDSEWIRLFIAGDSLEVRGTYWLTCEQRNARRVSLFYPFPVDSLLGGARMVSLRTRIASRSDTIPSPWTESAWQPRPGGRGVGWLTPGCTGDTIVFDGIYRQKIETDYARYIVTTTRGWQRPLRRARFEIHLPPGAEPLAFSFPFESRRDRAGEVYYAFEATDFFPEEDIVVRWRMTGSE